MRYIDFRYRYYNGSTNTEEHHANQKTAAVFQKIVLMNDVQEDLWYINTCNTYLVPGTYHFVFLAVLTQVTQPTLNGMYIVEDAMLVFLLSQRISKTRNTQAEKGARWALMHYLSAYRLLTSCLRQHIFTHVLLGHDWYAYHVLFVNRTRYNRREPRTTRLETINVQSIDKTDSILIQIDAESALHSTTAIIVMD